MSEALHIHGIVLPSGESRDVFVVDGRITFMAPDQLRTVQYGGYLIPGLVDAHAHLGLASPLEEGTPEEIARASAKAQLTAGVLAVREPGGPNYASKDIAPHEGLPRVQSAGRMLTPHGTYFPHLSRYTTAEELPDAAEGEARKSGAWAKVIGDWAVDGRMMANYPVEAMTEAARRVHALGARIAVHATSPEAIERAIEPASTRSSTAGGLRTTTSKRWQSAGWR